MNRSLVFDLATATSSLARRCTFSRPTRHRQKPSGPGHRQAVIGQGYRVIYREAHVLLEEIATRPSMENAKSTWNCWPPCPCSSSMTWGCVS